MANFTPQEIEAMLREFFDVTGKRQYIGARYVPIFGRKGESSIEWDNSSAYEPLTIVLYQGNSYTSRQYVPTGIDIFNTDFWVQSGNWNAQIEQYRQEVLGFQDQIDDKVPYPIDPNSRYGTLGQVLSTLADGKTKWDDPVIVDATIAEPLIDAWLTEHPEATTTVEDGAITYEKLAESLLKKIQTFNNIVNYNNYTALPTLESAQTNSRYIMTFNASIHPVDYPVDFGYGTCTLFTYGDDSYKVQYVTRASSAFTYAIRVFYSNTWHGWTVYTPTISDDEIVRDMLNPSLDDVLTTYNGQINYNNYQTLLPTLADAQINSNIIITMNAENHQSDYPTAFGYQTDLLVTIGDEFYKTQYLIDQGIPARFATRRFFSNAWTSWTIFNPNARLSFYANISYTNYLTRLPTLADAPENSIYYITMNAENHQPDYPTEIGYTSYLLVTIGDVSLKEQYIFGLNMNLSRNAHRRYFSNTWHDWEITYNTKLAYTGQVNYNNYSTLLPTFADAIINSMYAVTMTSATHQTDYPTEIGYGTIELLTYGDSGYKVQWAFSATINKKYAKRRFFNNAWQSWQYSPQPRTTITVAPSGGNYTNIVTALEYAYNTGNVDVIVKDGTYDFVAAEKSIHGATYFEDANFNNYGPLLGNNCTYYFEAGAQVNCILPSNASESAQNKYAPFNAGSGDYEIVGLRAYTEFCRYTIHDEMHGEGTYHHVYKDCYLHHNDTGAGYVQCIGGGLGAHGLIDIDGCVFESDTSQEVSSGIVSWHNGSLSDIQSFINIRNCYFKNGHVRFSWYGTSTLISELNICGCSFATTIAEERAETASSTIVNTMVREWNNEVRS